jgi:multiple sugar transport system substrate-binding protein
MPNATPAALLKAVPTAMPALRALLLGTASAALIAGTAAAQSVEWTDDGRAIITLGPDYDSAQIEVPAEDMGGLFGPGEQPFAGDEITVITLDSGPKGGISGPIYAFRPIFEELTGAKLNIALVPISELYTKIFLDLRNGSGEYDGMIVGAFMYGDLIDGNYILPVDDWRESGDFPAWSYDVMPESLRNIYTWDDVGYGVLNDADGQVLYYRRDLLTDPEHQAAFEAEHGYAMPVPPATLQQLKDIAAYFHGKNFDDNDADPDSGVVLHLKVREQGLYHFMTLATSFAVTPGELSKTQGVYWFDPEDMTPLINSPGHVMALEYLKDLAQYGPDAQVSWSLGEAWDYFLRGKAVFNFSYGDVAPLAQDETRSNIRGKIGSAILPASDTYWDMNQQAFVSTDEPRKVGNVTGGSWHGVVSSLSDAPETTYAFWSLMAVKPVSKWLATYGWNGVDPGYDYQFLEPVGEAKLEDYLAAGWDETDVTEYLGAYYENFNAETMLPYLRITGTQEYYDILDSNLSAAMSGSKTPKQALDDTAAGWQQVTDRLGREKQLEAYQAAIGWKG